MYHWCNTHYDEKADDVSDSVADEAFAARDLIGGLNRHWAGTLLMCLYEKHLKMGESLEIAIKYAAMDAGRLLKWIIQNDNRSITYVPSTSLRKTPKYRWDGTPPDWKQNRAAA